MQEPDTLSFSPLSYTPFETGDSEPPRKRLRIAEGEVSLATTDSNCAPSPKHKSSAASPDTTTTQSTSPLASLPWSRTSMPNQGDVLDTSDVPMGDATSSTMSRSGSASRPGTCHTNLDSEGERRDGVLLEGMSSLLPIARAEGGDRGDLGRAPPNMDGLWQSRAKAANEVQTEPSSPSGTSTLSSRALGSDSESAVTWEPRSLSGQLAAEGTSAHRLSRHRGQQK